MNKPRIQYRYGYWRVCSIPPGQASGEMWTNFVLACTFVEKLNKNMHHHCG
jgi:hypothetical protein